MRFPSCGSFLLLSSIRAQLGRELQRRLVCLVAPPPHSVHHPLRQPTELFPRMQHPPVVDQKRLPPLQHEAWGLCLRAHDGLVQRMLELGRDQLVCGWLAERWPLRELVDLKAPTCAGDETLPRPVRPLESGQRKGVSILNFTTHMMGVGGVGVGSIFSWLSGLHGVQL